MRHALAQGLERHAQGDSPLHRRDARAKLLAALVILVCLASFPKYAVLPLLPLALVPALFLVVGLVPLRTVAIAVVVTLPFVLAVGAANPVFDRVGGWTSLASLALRAAIGVAVVTTIVATTGVPRLAHAGGSLRVPQAFVVQMLLVHRYLGVLMDEAATLRRSWRLRQPRGLPSRATAQALLTTLLGRALARAVRIHQAMCARGFAGRMPLLAPPAWRWADTGLLAAVVLWCAVCRYAEPVPWLGARVLEAVR